MAIVGMIVVRQLCRKMKTTKTTSSSASASVMTTSRIGGRDEARRVVVHRVGDPVRESASTSSSIFSLTCCCRSSAFDPGIWKIAEDDRRILAEIGGRRILQGAELDARDVPEPHDGAAGRVGAHDDVGEFLRDR